MIKVLEFIEETGEVYIEVINIKLLLEYNDYGVDRQTSGVGLEHIIYIINLIPYGGVMGA